MTATMPRQPAQTAAQPPSTPDVRPSTPNALQAALDDANRRAERYRGWWAGLKVDTDRQIREASARALDCTEHGRIIAELEQQLHQTDTQHRAADHSRRAYIAGLHNLADALAALQQRINADDPNLPNLAAVVTAMAAAVAEIQHNGRWR